MRTAQRPGAGSRASGAGASASAAYRASDLEERVEALERQVAVLAETKREYAHRRTSRGAGATGALKTEKLNTLARD